MIKKYKFLTLIITTIILVLTTAPARAAIIYLQNDSYYEYGDSGGRYVYSTPSTDPAYWEARSNLDSTKFSDSASVYTSYQSGERTKFDITFSLDEATNFVLTGTLYQYPNAWAPPGFASVSLFSGNDVIYNQAVYGSFEYDNFGNVIAHIAGRANIAFSEILTAGEYRFVATADGGDYGVATYQFEASTIPLPSAVWLFGSGLIGLIAFARRKTRY